MLGKAFYILFATAILMAMGWHFLADEETKPILMRLFVLFLGVSLGCLTLQSVQKGQIRLGPGRPLVQQDQNPFNFWAIIVFNGALALLLLSVGLFVDT
jgi:hypothetical protein